MLDQLHRALIAVAAGVLIAASGCGTSGSGLADDKQKSQDKNRRMASLAEYEATLNPADYDQDIAVVQKQAADERPAPVDDAPRDTATTAEEIVQGFRIQIFSTSNIDDANNAKSLALERFAADSIYILYDPPVYKVRVGDFTNRYDANRRLPEFIGMGYRDAWIVPDQIRKFGTR